MLSAIVKRNLLIFLGTLTWSVTAVKSGLLYSYGLGFWGPQGHDGIWHLSLIESLSRGNLSMPLYAGEIIKNYHLGFDLCVAALHLVTFIPVSWLYFQILPPLFALFTGLLVYRLIKLWTKSDSAALWSVFFTYFGGSLGWLVSLVRNGSLGGESLFWSQQAISTLINPPLALSLCLILLALLLLQQKRLWLAGLVFGLIPSIKIYGGMLALVGLFFATFKNKSYWKSLVLAGIISLILFIPTNLHSGSLIIWKPLWFLDSLMNVDHLNWPKYFSALSTYSSGHILYKAIPAYTIALIIFLIGNLSLRLIGLVSFKHPSKLTWWELFLFSAAFVGIVPPMLFLQQGTAWNTIQFFYYTQFILGILAGISIAKIRPNIIISLLIVAFTLPTTIGTLPNYLPSRPPAKLSNEELSALNFLKHLPSGVVLTVPYDEAAAAAAQPYPPRPLYLYESTSYVSAFTSHPVFMEDQVNLNITGYDWLKRRSQALAFFASPHPDFLQAEHISFIYLVGTQRQPLPNHIPNLQKVYSNSEVDIYKVQ